MPNPFEQLGKPKEVQYDEWGGAFSCQEHGCWSVAHIARYLKKQRVLTWECEKGHISRLEDVNE